MVDHGVCQPKKQVQVHHTSTASPAGPLLGPNEYHLLGTKLQNRIPERKQVRLLFSEKKKRKFIKLWGATRIGSNRLPLGVADPGT